MAALFLILSTHLFAGEIVIATVAQVKNHVITTREIKIQYVVDRALKRDWFIKSQKEPVEQLIREWLLYFEANDFYNSKLSKSATDKVLRKLDGLLPKVKGWGELQVSPAELRKIVSNKLEADRLFEFKKKASKLPVSDAEIESEYKQNRVRYGTESMAKVREKIKKRKIRESLEERLGNWFAVLDKKYNVQRFVEYNPTQ